MSRRKQARPIKHLEEEGVVPAAGSVVTDLHLHHQQQQHQQQQQQQQQQQLGESSASCSEEDASCADGGVGDMMVTIPSIPGAAAAAAVAGAAALVVGGEPPFMCPRCQEQFTEVTEFLTHKTSCDRKAQRHQDPAHSDPEDMVVSEYEDEEDDEESSGKRMEQARRHRQDAANNNSVDEEGSERGDMEQMRIGFPFPLAAPPSASHVTLEALQNTKVAVAQFAATAMANNADNEAALQELAVLQSTLFTLQHQQVFQLQLINQLQQQLSLNRSKESSPASPTPDATPGPATTDSPPQPAPSSPSPSSLRVTTPVTPNNTNLTGVLPQQQQLHQQQQQHHHQQSASITFTSSSDIILPPSITDTISTSTLTPTLTSTASNVLSAVNSPPLSANMQPHMCSISSSLAASIITNNDPPPSLDEPNTLEMLQKRAQEVLDNASQGLLANNLADELAFRKSKGSMSPYDSKSGRNEPFFKHRCRYCGKVFGSDSALQIHIRSHTGERPFKCNVCGSRFTTKGNLKVHFQRHTAKFPHIKMNPNPVPEHLDKYHPPLLAQMGQQSALSPGGPVHHPPHPFPSAHPFPPTSIPIYRPAIPPPELLQNRLQPSPHRPQDVSPRVLPPHPIFGRRDEQDMPENLSKPARSPAPASVAPESRLKTEPGEVKQDTSEEPKISPINSSTITPKQEMDTDNEPENDNERYQSPPPYDECSMDSKYSNEDLLGRRSPMDHGSENMQEEPENLSNKLNSVTAPLSISTGQRLPASFNFPHASSPPSSTSSGSLGPFSTQSSTDPAKDPAVYTCLLPRPGSNDNSWESLIEVTKTSETSKLQQLVDNIEHKLTDPNQCVICHRVLSCKSALQMHYRTHTGERPFKCKICGRAFTTKGNLKTHMGVHRAKPPMRVLHQCPVCHKKFTNALVLQQHIRLHTGEPTDLTPEQIQAAEIKDFPSPGAFPTLPNSMNPFLGQNFPVPGLSALSVSGLPLNMKASDMEIKGEHDFGEGDDDDDDDDMDMSMSDQHMPSFSTSLAALENQVRTITTMASQLSASNCSAEDLCSSRTITTTPTPQNGDKSPTQSGITSPNGSEIRSSPNQTPVQSLFYHQIPRPPSNQQPNSPTPSESNSLGALDLTPRAAQPPTQSPGPPPMFSNFGLLPPSQGSSPLMSSALSSLTSSVLTSTAFSPLGLAVGPGVRGNTTCNICFKTFACNSALEIHYRSHTKERPFKCTVCDRGFSTKNRPECSCRQGQRRIQDGGGQKPRRVRKKKPPSSSSAKILASKFPPLTMNPGYATAYEWSPLLGNMKQHMLTHKIRDMPQHMFDKPISAGGGGGGSIGTGGGGGGSITSNPSQPMTPGSDDTSSTRDMVQHIEPEPVLPPPELPLKSDISVKRATSESELPLPKRPPNVQSSKHLCHVCNKNFSSSSALQIHMRTHTGDKPFRCTVCQKAFTTKGNLKVHMGTHMWSNGASRRGRRMSLDLPPIPMTPKDSEFLQRRPDLFYPYLPAPFLNGMQQKLNEISVIQNANNGLPNAGKYTGLLGFGYPPPDAVRAQADSPVSEKPAAHSPGREVNERTDREQHQQQQQQQQQRDMLPRVWDLHYERKTSAGDQAMEVSPSSVQPPPLNLQPPPRGEGLAA